MTAHPPQDLRAKNRRVMVLVLVAVFGMVGLSFAAVPLYRAFCQITGFGGTTMLAEKAPDESEIIDRTIRIRFNTDTGRGLNWRFQADLRQLPLKLGQQGIITFSAKNMAATPANAVAVYNVTPPKAGKYFHKLACFCFGEQTLNPGEEASYPVVFFIDPAMNDDPNMQDVSTITLSYIFYHSGSDELERAMESFAKNVILPDPSVAGTVALPPEKQ